MTVAGRPVAVLEPIARRRRWLSRDEFARRFGPYQADAALSLGVAVVTLDAEYVEVPGLEVIRV